MRIFVITIISLLLLPFSIIAQEMPSTTSELTEIKGDWTIDLRPSKDAEAYLQVFTITAIQKKSFTGRFYGSPLQKVVVNENWDKLYFSFITEDANNEYYHVGYFSDKTVFGITYCPNRKFSMPWTGEKNKE